MGFEAQEQIAGGIIRYYCHFGIDIIKHTTGGLKVGNTICV